MTNTENFTDIFEAAERGTLKDVQYFVEYARADVNAPKNQLGMTPLHMAAKYNSDVKVLEYLLAKKANVNAKNQSGCTPLFFAAANNPNADVLQCLVDCGADVNAKEEHAWTPLDFAHTDEQKRILREAGGKSGKALN